MKNIEQTVTIAASVEGVWQALVDPKQIEKWSGAPALMSAEEGDKFSLWDGGIYGQNRKVNPPYQLTQDWYEGDWPEASIVTFTLKEENGQIELRLKQANIPDEEVEEIRKGWEDYYLGAIKKYLEEDLDEDLDKDLEFKK